MTKSADKSFIIWCTPFSEAGRVLNHSKPTYNGKFVSILQTETIYTNTNDYKECIIMFELIYEED